MLSNDVLQVLALGVLCVAPTKLVAYSFPSRKDYEFTNLVHIHSIVYFGVMAVWLYYVDNPSWIASLAYLINMFNGYFPYYSIVYDPSGIGIDEWFTTRKYGPPKQKNRLGAGTPFQLLYTVRIRGRGLVEYVNEASAFLMGTSMVFANCRALEHVYYSPQWLQNIVNHPNAQLYQLCFIMLSFPAIYYIGHLHVRKFRAITCIAAVVPMSIFLTVVSVYKQMWVVAFLELCMMAFGSMTKLYLDPHDRISSGYYIALHGLTIGACGLGFVNGDSIVQPKLFS